MILPLCFKNQTGKLPFPPMAVSAPHSTLLKIIVLFNIIFSASVCINAQELPSLDFIAGKALFEKNWVFAPASTDASDGLGPYYNARSCNQCHVGGGRGDPEQALTFHINDPVYGQQLQKFSRPGVPAEALVSLSWTDNRENTSLRTASVAISDLYYGELTSSALSLRLAPSLKGLGQLEKVPDAVIEALADPEDADGDGISGRVNRLPDGRLGRFGWKAAQAGLREQTGRALSLDLGLGNPLQVSAYGDCTPAQSACLETPSGNGSQLLEVNETVLALLLTYIRELPGPEQANFSSGNRQRGARVFAQSACNQCHLPQIESESGTLPAYTDLLLHDMGPGLADQLEEGSAAGNEWRTPPLWGLGQAGTAFLHDGRARNLHEAILWHDGEAGRARKNYEKLSAGERNDLTAFLIGL